MGFRKRLEQACRQNPDIPRIGMGKHTVIARKMKVSSEAVRRWFNGEAQPRPQMMKALANFLNVDHVWLSLGTDFREMDALKDVAKQNDIGLYAFCGYAVDKGYRIGIDDSVSGADLVLVKNTSVRYVKVINANLFNTDSQNLQCEQQDTTVTVVLAVRTQSSGFSFEFLEIPDIMKRCKIHKVIRSEDKILVNGVNLNLFS